MTASSRWPRRGEIWWAYTPGQPDDPHQPRPALVVSVDVRNRLRDDLIVVPIFSTSPRSVVRVPVPRGVGGLPNDSVLFCDEVSTIDRDFLAGGPMGPLVPDDIMAQVIAGVLNAIAP